MNDTAARILELANLDYTYRPPILLVASRWSYFPALFKSLGFKTGAEIGVKKGTFSRHLCQVVRGLHLYSVDPWLSYPGYEGRNKQRYQNGNYKLAAERLAKYNCTIVRKMSLEAAQDFADNSLDFVYIDANHVYEHARADIAAWSRVVRPGGILAGDDYLNARDADWCGVKRAVDEWTAEQGIDPWFVIVGGRRPNWFWVKE